MEALRSLRCRVGCSSHVSQLSLLGPGRLLSALDRWGQYLLRHEAETLCLGVDKPVHTSAGPKLGYDMIADEIPTRHARTSRAAPRLSVVRTERVRLSQRGRVGFKKLATRLRMATMNVGSMTIENYNIIFCGITGKGRGLVGCTEQTQDRYGMYAGD